MDTLFTQNKTEIKILQRDDQKGGLPTIETDSGLNKNLKYKYDLKIGEIDCSGARVTNIYAHQKDKYVIYSTAENCYPTVLAENEVPLRSNAEVCKELLQYRDYKENDPHLKNRFNSGYALAVSCVLENKEEVGLAGLKMVREEMEGFLQREATYFYMLGAAVATALVLVNHLFFYLNETTYQVKTQGVYYAVLFAALGGFLSVALGSGKINVELRNDEFIKAIYGALRIAIAIVSGVLVYYLLMSGSYLNLLNLTQPIPLYVMCAAAGFLEKLVPNMLQNAAGSSSRPNSAAKES